MFTAGMSVFVAYACISVESGIVMLAGFCTLTITLALTIYAWTTKTDFTDCGGVLFVLLISFCLFGILAVFTKNPIMQIAKCCFGVFIYGLYLIYDT
jgi:protein lifeguard